VKQTVPPVPFIVFSDDWGAHPSSSQHIFRHISKHHRVAWVNTVGMRRPRLTWVDFKKGLGKLAGMLRRPAAQDDAVEDGGVEVFSPLMIPFNDIALIRRFNRRSVKRTLRRIMNELGDDLPVVVTTVPNACDFVDYVFSRKIVYYCVDDFSEWPGLDKELVLSMEHELIDKADLFLATSPELVKRLAASGKPTSLLSHGVDIELFSSDADEEHSVLRDIPRPRAGYFGLFDDRSDRELIAAVARRMPNVSFVIAGRVETDIEFLGGLENVHFVGMVPYAALPQLVKGLDVLFIPYTVNALSDALSPLKFKEYLATGCPIISTPIAAASEFREYISIASRAKDWQVILEEFIREKRPTRTPEIEQFLRGESWQDKAIQFLYSCEI
jgi:glycosyltransferase involved in cell wall biosynthesis